jgi:hypothetical protein
MQMCFLQFVWCGGGAAERYAPLHTYRMRRHWTKWIGLAGVLAALVARGQTINASQQVLFQGLRSAGGYGSFAAAAYAPDGSLYMLLDEHDGVRLMKTDGGARAVLAQVQTGNTGDAGVAMSVDSVGNVYVTGTTTSGTLTGTNGAAFSSLTDNSANSFVAKYDSNLKLRFLSFLGAGRTAATSVAATSDSVFVTGITFSNALPVTAGGIQQAPAKGSSENGFVERFSVDGSRLEYATYLTGVSGDTTPTAIVADADDNAYIAGATTASGFPTVAALEPEFMPNGTTAGFLTKLNAAGSAFIVSTYIAGGGISGMALDAQSHSLLLTGSVALGQFPVARVAMPLVAPTSGVSYQTLLRVPTDGQSVTQSVLLTAATTSFVSAGANGDAWISGAVQIPLFSGVTSPTDDTGDSYLLHVAASGDIDQTLRFGGLPKGNVAYASLASTLAAPAISGTTVTVPGHLAASVSAALAEAQRFDFPLVQSPNAALPNTLRDMMSGPCTGSVCSGSAAMLAQISTASAAPSLAIETDDVPNLTIRNLGSLAANDLAITASGYTAATNCSSTLASGALCSVAMTGSGPGMLNASASNAATASGTLSATTAMPDPVVVSTDELDFGIINGSSAQTVTVTNLGAQAQIFASALDGAASGYTLKQSATTCAAGAVGQFVVAANTSCTVTLTLAGTENATVATWWKIGTLDLRITGVVQAEALSASATEVDFGVLIAGGIRLPRYLYLSNNSSVAIAHTPVAFEVSSPFAVMDGCPLSLEPHSLCALRIGYQPASSAESDTKVLTLDGGLSVLLTGEALPATTVNGAAVNPSLSLSARSLNFATAVNVSGVSSTTQELTVTNTGANAFTLAQVITGDFTYINGCPATLTSGAQCVLTVSFAPSQPGARQGLLSLTAGSGFAPAYIALSGTGAAILPENNGVLNIGTTLVGEPAVAWYKVQAALPSLTANVNSGAFGVALVQDNGSGHGSLPTAGFVQSVTSPCGDCWLGVQYLSQTAQTVSTMLTLSTSPDGNPYTLMTTGTSLPVTGVVITPQTQDFGTAMIGSGSGVQVFTLANLVSPSADVTIQSIAASGDFIVQANTNGGATCSGALAATASCFITLGFTPTATGDRAGMLTVTTSSGVVTAVLTGYGTSSSGLEISPSSLKFDAVPGSAATQQALTLTNAGASILNVGAITSSDVSFTTASNCGTLTSGSTCSVTVSFVPGDAMISASLSILMTETVNGQSVSTSYTVPLAGDYTAQDAGLEILPGNVNFGAAATGSIGGTREFTLNNLTASDLTITLQIPRQFPLAAAAPCLTIAAGKRCTFSTSFVPIETGAATGTVLAQGVSADGTVRTQGLAYMQGYGNGAGALQIFGGTIPFSPLMFGQVTSGQTTQQTLTLMNVGSGALTIRRISSAPPFLSTTTCGAALAAKATCTITITYAPVYEVSAGSGIGGTRNDTETLSIESDATTSPDMVPMTGLVLPITSSSPASSAVLASFELGNSALTFANTQVGNASPAQTLVLTNTGTQAIHVLGVLAPTDFTVASACSRLAPGAQCSVKVTFTPTTASSSTLRTGALELQTDATDSLEYVTLLGSSSAASLDFSQTTLDFGTVNVGTSTSLSVSVTNNSSMPITFTGLSATAMYNVAQGTCPALGYSLAAGSSCTLVVTFAPTTAGVQNGTLSLSSDATTLPLTIVLNGTGVAASLQVLAGALNFGSIAVGASSQMTLTLTNVGSTTLTGIANHLAGAAADDFAVIAPCRSTELAAGASCVETVRFAPRANGVRAATLIIAGSDPSGPIAIPLGGNGVSAGTFALTVNGTSADTLTVVAGQPATYALLVTPMNGYAGNVALTCSAITPGPHASCSLLSPLLNVTAGAVGTSATISTVSAADVRVMSSAWLWLLLPLGVFRKKKLRALAAAFIVGCLAVVGCGNGPSSGFSTSGSPSTTANTPAGSYQYIVTASSTSGTAISSSVTLNLTVQ